MTQMVFPVFACVLGVVAAWVRGDDADPYIAALCVMSFVAGALILERNR